MKYLRIIIMFAVLLISQAKGVYARRAPNVEREKKISTHYNVQSADRLVIDNTYGMVHINTWDKNEVTIDITIKVKAINADKADEIMDRVSFKQESNDAGSHRIYYKTIIGPVRTKNNNTLMEVNYVINAPKKMAIDIANKYGDIYLDDFLGRAIINLSYGAFSAKNLSGPDKDITVAYGKGAISAIETGSFNISYSDFTIEKAQMLDIKNVFGKLNIGSVQSLALNQKYGDLDLGSVGVLSGSVDYASINVDALLKSTDLNITYCGKAAFRSIGAGAEHVKINTSYSSLFLHVEPAASMVIDVTTSYGEINNGQSALLPIYQERKTGTSATYKGKAGAGAGSMVLNARYGNITFK